MANDCPHGSRVADGRGTCLECWQDEQARLSWGGGGIPPGLDPAGTAETVYARLDAEAARPGPHGRCAQGLGVLREAWRETLISPA